MRAFASLTVLLLLHGCPAARAGVGLETGPAPADAEIVSESIELNIASPQSAYEIGTRTVRILSEAGIDEATFVLPVFPFTEAKEIRGTLTLPSGKKRELEPGNVIEQPLLSEPAVSREVKLLRASFPGVTVGSTVRVSWRRELRSLLYVNDWIFRGTLPIERSTLKVVAPRDLVLKWAAVNGQVEPVVTDEEATRVYTFSIEHAPALVPELYAPPVEALLGKVQFFFPELEYGPVSVDAGTWKGVAEFYSDLAEGRDALEHGLADQFRVETKKKSPHEVIVAALDRLAAFRYVQVYLGVGGYQPHAAQWTWQRRYGDCKDLATVLVAMLRAGGVEAYPMLTRIERGYRFLPDLPSPRQFNHCVAYVPLKEGPLVLDATAPFYPPGTLPGLLGGAPGLVVKDRDRYELLTLPAALPSTSLARVDLVLEPAAGGGVQGTFRSELTGDHRGRAWHLQLGAPDQLEGAQTAALLPAMPGARLSEIRYHDEGGVLTVEGRIASAAEPLRSGRERLVGPALLGADRRALAFGASTRQHPIDLGDADERTLTLHWRSPGPARCPEPRSLDSAFGSYKLSCRTGEGEVVLERSLAVARPWIEIEDYPGAAQFWSAVLGGDQLAAAVPE